jgi:hypothetical protein
MTANTQINLPTPIGPIDLSMDQIFSFSPDGRGGVVIILKEMVANARMEIISGYSFKAFSEWFEANNKRDQSAA